MGSATPLITVNDMVNVCGIYVEVTKQSLFENTMFCKMAIYNLSLNKNMSNYASLVIV